ncbi:hypothetical protein GMAR_ORF124 [Golden Marseillevirus]|uniref:hypothetical protein n=1 Tax=Golden Marseillevirus TaxID=1720526 RepID=UPI000877AC5A|nr:hypothetical protein GMAR_ORF124 [Golden Marseillevirus]ALX27498.1 hypothetical protein GMAR_ORF124 [Golden Marseillevirus]
MFWGWSCVLTDKGEVDFCNLESKHGLVTEDGKVCEFGLVKEKCFEVYHIVLQIGDKEFILYVTRFTRFFRQNGDEAYALELKKGDVLQGREGKVTVKEHRKFHSDIFVYKVLIKEDKAFFVDGVKVKKS